MDRIDSVSMLGRDYAGSGEAAGPAYANETRAVDPAGPLEAATQRIHEMAHKMEQAGIRLREHADQVFGAVPEADCKNGPSPVRAGQIGAMHDALDRLERVHNHIFEQVQRNCTLA